MAIQFIQPRIIKPQKAGILKIGAPVGNFLKKFATKLVQAADSTILEP